ncbi:hypothetical protein [Cupriavidus sp. UYPR2.512]|uniref:ATP-dependent DNA ligase n=1 Tax=Cupriavidus sp. UYPR2.512 TaxID=1080187 RepID=UPI002101790A|nr:hypothetical protein [Cupriavidus sp. UYPR2.512]
MNRNRPSLGSASRDCTPVRLIPDFQSSKLFCSPANSGFLQSRRDPVVYGVFDLLVGKGKDLRGQPLERRKPALRKLIGPADVSLRFLDSVEDGAWLYGPALALGLEGVVGKRAGSTYQAGDRSRDWVKVKRPGMVPPERFKR